MNIVTKHRSLFRMIFIGAMYAVIGIAFPNPATPGRSQVMWRLGAWLASAIVYASQILYEHFRLRNSPARIGLHACVPVALGAFAIAVAANIHALSTSTGNQRLLLLALAIWPIVTAAPAFVVALATAFGLSRMRENYRPSSA